MKSIVIIAGIATMLTPVCLEHKLRSSLDDGLCRRAVEYQQTPGVEYQPGVDVTGNPVMEADLNKSPVNMPEEISISVSVDLAQYLGLPIANGNEAYADVGELIYKNGAFTFNGEPLDGRAADSLRKLCAVEKPAKPAKK